MWEIFCSSGRKPGESLVCNLVFEEEVLGASFGVNWEMSWNGWIIKALRALFLKISLYFKGPFKFSILKSVAYTYKSYDKF